MRWTRSFPICAMLILASLAHRSPAADEFAESRREASRELLNAHLVTLAGADRASLVDVTSESLDTVFADSDFFGLRFARYPVAIAPPDSLSQNNLFAINGKEITLITDIAQLEAFFKKRLGDDMNEQSQRAATEAWLALVQELNEDGFFEFEKPQASRTGDSFVGEVGVVESRGDRGKLTVTVAFERGRIASVTSGGELSPGIRPRCQATRLLDPDLAVRDIMRKDILVMGTRCRTYLDDVRTNARPELQQAIDDVWKQILEEGR